MYKVKVLIVKEVVEVVVDAKYCLVDGNNNLVFQDKALSVGEPLGIISASRWVAARRLDG